MTNHFQHHEAILNGDVAENIRLSKVSDARRKSRQRKMDDNEKCNSDTCFVTRHDVNVEQVLCDKCHHWSHTVCEAITPLQEILLANVAEYECLKCRGVVDKNDIFNDTITTLRKIT